MNYPREFIKLPPMTRERIAAAIESLSDILDALDAEDLAQSNFGFSDEEALDDDGEEGDR